MPTGKPRLRPPRKTAPDTPSSMREELRSFKRERILEEAGRLFYERGYHGTSLDAIAERLGVTKPFIYYHYHNKTELLTEIYSRVVDYSLDCLRLARQAGGSPVDMMSSFARHFARLTIQQQAVVAVFFQEVSNIPTDHLNAINRLKKQFDDQLADLIREGNAQGVFRADDPRLAALAITGMISWVYTWYRSHGRLGTEEICEHMANFALRIVQAAGGK